jgi:hypothetical protein
MNFQSITQKHPALFTGFVANPNVSEPLLNLADPSLD